jgi:hypothetical protein
MSKWKRDLEVVQATAAYYQAREAWLEAAGRNRHLDKSLAPEAQLAFDRMKAADRAYVLARNQAVHRSPKPPLNGSEPRPTRTTTPPRTPTGYGRQSTATPSGGYKRKFRLAPLNSAILGCGASSIGAQNRRFEPS